MGILLEYVEKQALAKEKKINKDADKYKPYSPKDWMNDMVKNICHCRITTHIGKFTHPDSTIFLYQESASDNRRGYVMSSTAKTMVDYQTPAQYLGAANLLNLELEDGNTVLQHIQTQDPVLLKEFQELGIAPKTLLDAVQQVIPEDVKETDGKLRQVYFPIDKGRYHLLTVMPASSLLETVTSKIYKMNGERIAARDVKKETFGQDYADILAYASIRYGGANAQNVSLLNAKNTGHGFCLLSLPPVLEERKIRLPKRNFFEETLIYKNYVELFRQLHKAIREDKSNMRSRERIQACITALIDEVLIRAEEVNKQEKGWSQQERYLGLPQNQKVWLDPEFETERNEETWIPSISNEFARWALNKYKQVLKDDAILLGDDFLTVIRKEMEKALKQEVRYSL